MPDISQNFTIILKQGGFLENLFDPVIRIDVENRCAVMLVYGRHLVVLPFKQEGPIDDSDQLQSGYVILFPASVHFINYLV